MHSHYKIFLTYYFKSLKTAFNLRCYIQNCNTYFLIQICDQRERAMLCDFKKCEPIRYISVAKSIINKYNCLIFFYLLQNTKYYHCFYNFKISSKHCIILKIN